MPSLFPQFMDQGTGGGPTTIVRAILAELEVELAPVYDAELPAVVEADLPEPVTAELPEPVEAEL